MDEMAKISTVTNQSHAQWPSDWREARDLVENALEDSAEEATGMQSQEALAQILATIPGLTGISDTALLRASHIIPWKDCASDRERLDVHNGLLLSALWDAAFDRGLVTFGDDGFLSSRPR